MSSYLIPLQWQVVRNADGLYTFSTPGKIELPGWGYKEAIDGEHIVYEYTLKQFGVSLVLDLPAEYNDIY